MQFSKFCQFPLSFSLELLRILELYPVGQGLSTFIKGTASKYSQAVLATWTLSTPPYHCWRKQAADVPSGKQSKCDCVPKTLYLRKQVASPQATVC